MDTSKVRFCTSFINYGKCKYKDCTFIHNASELYLPKCNCSDVLCRNHHPNETDMQLFSKNLYHYTHKINISAIPCRYGDDCKNMICKYAHNSSQLIMIFCPNMCDDKKCTYRHNETRNGYFDRMKKIHKVKRPRNYKIELTITYPKNKSRQLMDILKKYNAITL